MGEAAEAFDYGPVSLGVAEERCERSAQPMGSAIDQGPKAGHATFLVAKMLGVFEREEEEQRLEGVELQVPAEFERFESDLERGSVAVEGVRRAAKQIAWELVECDHERECRPWLATPGRELSAQRPIRQLAEVQAEPCIEGRVRPEPERGSHRHGFGAVEVGAEPCLEKDFGRVP